jgi:Putative adhesin
LRTQYLKDWWSDYDMSEQPILRIRASIPLRSSFLAIALVVLLASAFAAASTPQGTFDKTFQVSGPVNLEVQTHSGDIIVRSGPAGSVSIRGKIFVSDHWLAGNRHSEVAEIEQKPPLRQDGNSIHIDYVNARDISVDYEITVPADTAVRAHTGSGDQTIEGVHGDADLESGSGDMRLSQLTGEIRVHTGSGNVKAREIAGPVRGGAGSGDIEVEETGAGDIDLHTGSGNVTVRGIQGAFRAEAGSGDITAEGAQTGGWEIRTGSGNVHVRLPANAAFDADISTSSGTLDIAAPITMTVQGRVQETHKHIAGKVRGGGPLLSLRTGSGDIHIE